MLQWFFIISLLCFWFLTIPFMLYESFSFTRIWFWWIRKRCAFVNIELKLSKFIMLFCFWIKTKTFLKNIYPKAVSGFWQTQTIWQMKVFLCIWTAFEKENLFFRSFIWKARRPPTWSFLIRVGCADPSADTFSHHNSLVKPGKVKAA